MIEAHVEQVDRLLRDTPLTSAKAEGDMLAHVTNMTLSLPGQRASERGAEATGEAFMMALDDLPPWAVAAAIRRWYRGDAPPPLPGHKPHDYAWRPAPAVLRAIAFSETAELRTRVRDLRRLLSAECAVEYTEEHRQTMLQRLAGLFGSMSRNAPTTKEVEDGKRT